MPKNRVVEDLIGAGPWWRVPINPYRWKGYVMNTYDFSPLSRYSVGFDRIESLMVAAMNNGSQAQSYPPYNIESVSENAYRVTMAIAGFCEEDLDIIQKENSLIVKGKVKNANKEVSYLHRGIANRAFERRFELADYVEVVGANLANGMLIIDLERELPEALKPRTIEIKNGSGAGFVGKAKKLLGNEEQVAA